MSTVPVVDVFAGPGGLNEGFSAFEGVVNFSTVASIEMDPVACRTLRLRAALRKARALDGTPRVYEEFLTGATTLDALIESEEFAPHWKDAGAEVHQHELSEASRAESDALIQEALAGTGGATGRWVLIGGPPCQAYSLAGRSRRKHDDTFKDDHKHTLYREYLNIISKFSPDVFVMENVKGMLSSQHGGAGIFQAICEDLRDPAPGLSYQLRSFVVAGDDESLKPTDYIIRAESFGVPQARHRVILLGIRSDLPVDRLGVLAPTSTPATVADVICDLPKIRAGMTPRRSDSWENWLKAYGLGVTAATGRRSLPAPKRLDIGVGHQAAYVPSVSGDLGEWLREGATPGISLHESRHHMDKDLARYAYLAAKAEKGQRPRVNELPDELIPAHRNARGTNVPFSDRFRVQTWNSPSSTVTSHIAKDGHYYIHPDPKQMRSLTVREAARLQTFPDNYFFTGNRTQQYHQVGNAVPPYLARQLAAVVADLLEVPGSA